MANSTIDLLANVPWLVDYDYQAFVALERTIHNTDEQANTFIFDLLNSINAWKTQSNKSLMRLQSLFGTLYQGSILGVNLPMHYTVYSVGGFLPFIRSVSLNYSFQLELVPNENPLLPPTVESPVIASWVENINNAVETEDNAIEALEESIHQSSTKYLFNNIFNPAANPPIVLGNVVANILDTKGYRKLSILNGSLIFGS